MDSQLHQRRYVRMKKMQKSDPHSMPVIPGTGSVHWWNVQPQTDSLEKRRMPKERKAERRRISTMAQKIMKKGNYGRAISILEEGLEKYPKCEIFASQLIIAYGAVGVIEIAENIYRRFENVRTETVHVSMASAYYRAGEYEAGLEFIRYLMDEREDRVGGLPQIRIYEAAFLHRLGQQDNAIAKIDLLLEHFVLSAPAVERAVSIKAACLLELGQIDEAAELMKSSSGIDFYKQDNWLNLEIPLPKGRGKEYEIAV